MASADNPHSSSRIGREIRQSRPFRSVAQEATIGLLRTADVVRRHLAGVIERHGLTLQQYNVLRILRGAEPGGLPTLEVAERLIERAPGITRMMDRLEEKGWVRRERCREDRRQVLCYLTGAGRDLLAGLDNAVDAADETAVRGLSRAEQAELIGLLDRVRVGHEE